MDWQTQICNLSNSNQGISVEVIEHKLNLFTQKYADHCDPVTKPTEQIVSDAKVRNSCQLGQTLVKPLLFLQRKIADQVDAIPVDHVCNDLNDLFDRPGYKITRKMKIRNAFLKHYILHEQRGRKEIFFFELLSWIFVFIIHQRIRVHRRSGIWRSSKHAFPIPLIINTAPVQVADVYDPLKSPQGESIAGKVSVPEGGHATPMLGMLLSPRLRACFSIGACIKRYASCLSRRKLLTLKCHPVQITILQEKGP